MIDPHVLHGGASSWLRMAANEDGFGSVRLKPDPTDEELPAPADVDPPDAAGFTVPDPSGLTPGPGLTPDT